MRILSIKISNFLSIEAISLSFAESGLALVEGFDSDTGRANGAGKSAIFNAIAFALFDKMPKKISKSEVIRKGATSCSVEVVVSTSKGKYTVIRQRPGSVSYVKDNTIQNITQSEFEAYLGINYEQYLITMYNAQDSSERFICKNDVDKKTFILKLMNLEKFTAAKDQVSSTLKQLSSQLDLILTKISSTKENIRVLSETLDKNCDLESKLLENENIIKKNIAEISALELLKRPDLTQLDEAEAKILSKKEELSDIKANIKYKRKELTQLREEPSIVQDECPHCKGTVIINGNKLHSHSYSSNTDKQTKIKDLVDSIISLETSLLKENSFNEALSKIQNKRQSLLLDYNTSKSRIKSLRSLVDSKKTDNANLASLLERNKVNLSKLDNYKSTLEALNNNLSQLESEILLLNAVESIFDSTGAQAYIMDAIIDSFNNSVAKLLSEIWPNVSYEIRSYKENKDKTIKAKMSEYLTKDGKPWSLGALSGGEFKTLSLIIDFALLEILEAQYGLRFNPIILDEPFNGLDATGREKIIPTLTKIAQNKQVLVVDHASEFQALFDTVISVEKNNGITTIKL